MTNSGRPLDSQTCQTKWKTAPLATGQSNLPDRMEDCSIGQRAVVWVRKPNFESFYCGKPLCQFHCPVVRQNVWLLLWLWNWLIQECWWQKLSFLQHFLTHKAHVCVELSGSFILVREIWRFDSLLSKWGKLVFTYVTDKEKQSQCDRKIGTYRTRDNEIRLRVEVTAEHIVTVTLQCLQTFALCKTKVNFKTVLC